MARYALVIFQIFPTSLKSSQRLQTNCRASSCCSSHGFDLAHRIYGTAKHCMQPLKVALRVNQSSNRMGGEPWPNLSPPLEEVVRASVRAELRARKCSWWGGGPFIIRLWGKRAIAKSAFIPKLPGGRHAPVVVPRAPIGPRRSRHLRLWGRSDHDCRQEPQERKTWEGPKGRNPHEFPENLRWEERQTGRVRNARDFYWNRKGTLIESFAANGALRKELFVLSCEDWWWNSTLKTIQILHWCYCNSYWVTMCAMQIYFGFENISRSPILPCTSISREKGN